MSVDKQEGNKKPATGFHTNPERINRAGRPKKGQSITDMVSKYLENVPEGEKLTLKQQFVMKVIEKALKGDEKFMKLVWNYIDGMPNQKLEMDGGMKLEQLIYSITDPVKDGTKQTETPKDN